MLTDVKLTSVSQKPCNFRPLQIFQTQRRFLSFQLGWFSGVRSDGQAYELFETSKVEQKRQLINFVFSKLQLREKTLEFSIRKPFDLLLKASQRAEWGGLSGSNR